MFGHKVFLRIGKLTDASIKGLEQDSYELQHCSFSFSQGIDKNGKPQTDVRGGAIHATYLNLPANDLFTWAMKSTKYHDGVLVICDMDNQPISKIYFEHATCVGLEITYAKSGGGYAQTQFTIQPEIMRIDNGKKLDNNWTNIN